ncbi:hypothetical protein IGI04_014463 [Brassica rapa subsp. trilocularis]|uniref:Uncharacterized protein n=1 Tax=Brassica rapa subsp. trilocularis TaxID=1813537 RepID=A0ABQ7MM94_BRACM|nr:hypothetical protein IGI04_014463 [Brassica rapa subsp. trilocularis]
MNGAEYTSAFSMLELWNGQQEFDLHDQGTSYLAKHYNKIGKGINSSDMLPGLQGLPNSKST